MKICPICREGFLKGQKISVISSPLECMGRDGSYGFIKDFSEHEEVYHFKCVSKTLQRLENPQEEKEKPADLGSAWMIKDYLESIGETAGVQQIQMFLIQHPELQSTEDII